MVGIVVFRGERGSYNNFPLAADKAARNRKTARFALPRQQGKTSVKLFSMHSTVKKQSQIARFERLAPSKKRGGLGSGLSMETPFGAPE
jgi:hypothetical protein